ncbi:zinc ribbon domain-containing protein [Mobilitalea sibirica]|uniref:Zinc ribbon domain-containing protein n=1 Tax=Mobilitalea sibirica TaxID=1462919 RepID=A0A8J7H1Y3_9FIRM|nr:zinc ribbon domain-containing protein [Mobilitalea sibirica]MBH1940588.1 zinc ribbon domain-containing protein [Mobilitalea sibirica]
MENMKLCQSCGMPLGDTDELYGTDADGSKNSDYCVYCFKDGAFTSDMSMDEMIDFCVPHMVSGNEGMSEDTARNTMQKFFPTLKRWKAS